MRLESQTNYQLDGTSFAAVCKIRSQTSIVAAGFGDGSLLVYDYEKNEKCAIMKDHIFAINDIDWSPHFSYIATCSDDTMV